MDKIMKDSKNITIACLVIVVICLLGFNRCEHNKNKELTELTNNLGDSLEIKRNKDSSTTASISLLQAKTVAAYLALENLEGINKELQDELKKEKAKIKNGGSITIINSGTTYTGVATSTTIPFVNNPDCDSLIISQNADTTWIKWKVKASKKVTTLDLKTKDKFKVIIGSERVNLFKRKPIVEVTSLNPYSEIKSMRAFEVKDNRKPFISVGIQVGYGITMYGLSPYIGIGGQLNLFTIWK